MRASFDIHGITDIRIERESAPSGYRWTNITLVDETGVETRISVHGAGGFPTVTDLTKRTDETDGFPPEIAAKVAAYKAERDERRRRLNAAHLAESGRLEVR